MQPSLLRTVASLSLLLIVPALLFAGPAHPTLHQMIQNGEIEAPYAYANSVALHDLGVDAPNQVNLQNDLDVVNFNLLVLLVDFNDQVSQVNANSYDNLFFGNSIGNVDHYYAEISYNQFAMMTQNQPSSTGWFRMPQNYSYYVNNQNGFGNYPMNAQKMVEDAVAAADATVNFANYDHDGDGDVDGLVVLHSGTDASWSGQSSDMWAHAWAVPQPWQTNDGVVVTNYCTVPEFWAAPGDMTIGVIVHELGHHIFGLPDLYDIDYSSLGIGSWSLMSYGSWNGPNGMGSSPAHPDAWSRTRLGFLPPVNITEDRIGWPVAPIETLPDLFRMWTQGSFGQEYYLVESRDWWGYDQWLPGFGMLIWHIDDGVATGNMNEWYPGNMGSGHYQVALEQADGLWELEQNVNFGSGADPYPGWNQNMSFDNFSVPSSNDYAGNPTLVAVSNFIPIPYTIITDMIVGVPGPNPLISVQILPPGTPIWIPAGGGSITYSVLITNNLAQPRTGNMWFQALLPNNTIYQVSNQVVNVQPGVPLQFNNLTVNIPAFAPAGPYQYICNIGGFPNFIAATDHLEFTKQLLAPDGAESVGEWSLTGLENHPALSSTPSDVAWGAATPVEFKVLNAYPNPFNAQTTIEIALPQTSELTVTVYNTLGQHVATLAEGRYTAGQHQFTLDASTFSSGLYFLRASDGVTTATSKLMLMK